MRDDLAPEDRIRAAISEYGKAIAITLKHQRMDGPTVSAHTSLVCAHYTLGDPPRVCLEPGALLADRLAAYFRQQNDALDFRIDPRVFHDAVAAVYLAGKADVLFEAFARSSWPEELEPWLHGFCDLACRAFGGRSPGSASVPDPLPEVPKPLGAVAALLRVMSENEAQRFEGALVHFVTRAWGPGAEKGAKADLKSRWPLYTGRWSILAAAACRRMRITPDLPPKAQVYFPRELL